MFFDEGVKCVTVGDPSDETGVRRQWDDRVPLNSEVSSGRLRVIDQERIHEAEKLHHTLVLSQILVTCKGMRILLMRADVIGHSLE